MTDALIRFSQSRKNDIRTSNQFSNNKPFKNEKRKSQIKFVFKSEKKRKTKVKSVFDAQMKSASGVNEKRLTRIGQMPLPIRV